MPDSCAVSVPTQTDIPTEPKAFADWLDRTSLFGRWPDDLIAKGHRALWSMRAREQAAWDQSLALRRICKADWSAFTTAYREHVEGAWPGYREHREARS